MSATNRQECPSFETLSAWYDGEEQDNRIKAHIKACEECAEIVRDFEMLDSEISGHIESIAPSDASLQRMVKQTRYRLAPKTIKFLPMPILWRVAACVALILVVFGLMQRLERYGIEEGAPAADAELVAGEAEANPDELSAFEKGLINDLITEFGDSAKDVPESANGANGLSLPSSSVAAKAIGDSEGGVREAQVNSEGVLQLNNISLVGYGSPSNVGMSLSQPEVRNQQPQPVEDKVRHVWLVDDATAPLKTLQALMPNHKQDFAELIAQNRDEYVLQFVVQDRDLQELVNHFDALHYKLISPNGPQPGKESNVQLTGKPVQYELDFVRK